MNPYLALVLAIVIGSWLLDLVVEWLNLRYARPDVPPEFRAVFTEDAYRQSQLYLRDNTRFALLTGTVDLAVLLTMLFAGGFRLVDGWARALADHEITRGLIFVGVLALGHALISLPFSVYDTFVIEARYGFNKTTPRTFALDWLKGAALAVVLGGPIFAGVVWFFSACGAWAWLVAWAGFSAVQLLLVWLLPVLILPLFNKFTPLPDGELRQQIEAYARAQQFPLGGIYTMAGSKRTSKAHAFFTGFGRLRRIVLYDTLVTRHPVPELLAVLAHEMGHFRRRHIRKLLVVGMLSMGVLFFLLGRLIGNEGLFGAFGLAREAVSIYASLVFVSVLFGPINLVISVAVNVLSRRFEYEADAYAAATAGPPAHLVSALTRLSAESLSNLTPHPLKVFLEYSHPPVLDRVRALNALAPPAPPPSPAPPGPPAPPSAAQ